MLSKILGRKITYVAIDETTLRNNVTARVPAWLADIVVGNELAIQAGLQDRVTNTLQRLTGNAPRLLADFIRDNKATFSLAA